jgi:hypothetical protein
MSLVFDPSNPHFFQDINNSFPENSCVALATDSRDRVYLETRSCINSARRLFAFCTKKNYSTSENFEKIALLIDRKMSTLDSGQCAAAICLIDKLADTFCQSDSLHQRKNELIVQLAKNNGMDTGLAACQCAALDLAIDRIEEWNVSLIPYADLLLQECCQAGKFYRAIFFLRAGGNPYCVPEYMPSLFRAAMKKGDDEIASRLIGPRAQINHPRVKGEYPLVIAIEKNLPLTIRALIASHVNIFQTIERKGNYLHLAARLNRLDATVLLMDAGLNAINTQDQDGMTPLMHACQGEALDMMNLLRERGANLTLTNCKGETAFGIAFESGLSKRSKNGFMQFCSHFFPENSLCYTYLDKEGPAKFCAYFREHGYSLVIEQKRHGYNCLLAPFLLHDRLMAESVANYLTCDEYEAACRDLVRRYPTSTRDFLTFLKYKPGDRFYSGDFSTRGALLHADRANSASGVKSLYDQLDFEDRSNPMYVNPAYMAAQASLPECSPSFLEKVIEDFVERIENEKSAPDMPWNTKMKKQYFWNLQFALSQIVETIKKLDSSRGAFELIQFATTQFLSCHEARAAKLYNTIMRVWQEIVKREAPTLTDLLEAKLGEFRETLFCQMIGDGKKFQSQTIEIESPQSIFIAEFANTFQFTAHHVRASKTPFTACIDRQKVIDTFYSLYTPETIVHDAVMPSLSQDSHVREQFFLHFGMKEGPLTIGFVSEGLAHLGILRSRFSS